MKKNSSVCIESILDLEYVERLLDTPPVEHLLDYFESIILKVMFKIWMNLWKKYSSVCIESILNSNYYFSLQQFFFNLNHM